MGQRGSVFLFLPWRNRVEVSPATGLRIVASPKTGKIEDATNGRGEGWQGVLGGSKVRNVPEP